VKRVVFDKTLKIWDIYCSEEEGWYGSTKQTQYKARVLIAADGSESSISRKLGIVTSPPQTSQTMAYIKAGTHNFKPDGVVFFTPNLFPGYIVVFKQPGNALNIGYFSPTIRKNVNLSKVLHDDLVISKNLGLKAPLTNIHTVLRRTGGTPKSYADHFLVVGGAAGHADPFTGLGIQYGMKAAKIAAETLIDAFVVEDLTENKLKKYQEKCTSVFGWEFYWSRTLAFICWKFPIGLDALTQVIQNSGGEYLSLWALAMTGAKSKMWMIRPDLAFLTVLELIRIFYRRGLRAAFSPTVRISTSPST